MPKHDRTRFGYEFRISTKKEEIKKAGQNNVISTERNLRVYIEKFEENSQKAPKKKNTTLKDSVFVVISVLGWLWRALSKFFTA